MPPLQVLTFHVLALMKLKVWQEASLQLAAVEEAEGQWPFALRWLKAELPAVLGHEDETMLQMYALLDWCTRQAGAISTSQPSLQPEGAASRMWSSRRRRILFTLVAKHAHARQHRAALSLLNQLLQEDPTDGQAWSQAGRVQLLLGDVAAAQHSFDQSSAAAAAGGNQPPVLPGAAADAAISGSASLTGPPLHSPGAALAACATKDAALLQLLSGSPVDAVKSYAAVADELDDDQEAGANVGVCHVYAGNTAGGVRALEDLFRDQLAVALTEAAVVNLASLYDLNSGPGAAEAKRRMSAWVAAAAADDFSLAACKIAQPGVRA